MIEKKSSGNSEPVSNSESSFSIVGEAKVFPTLKQEEQSKALLLASQLDETHYETIIRFGEDTQKSLKHFTHNLLLQVQRNDTSPIREILSKLVEQLEMIDPDDLIEKENNFFKRLFKRSKSSIQQIVSQYNRLSKQIDRLSIHLKRAQNGLLSDVNMLNELYKKNEEYYQQITLYIAALELKKQDLQKQLQHLEQIDQQSENLMKEQQLNDLKNTIEWLDRRMYDLQVSREIAIQTAPQIRMIQSTNEMLVEKIQASVMTTIPLWQSQISMLIHMNRQRRANETSKRLMKASEQMVLKNADLIDVSNDGLKGQKAITHEDVDRFKETQLQLLESIEETLRIQADNNEKQLAIEKTIHEIEAK